METQQIKSREGFNTLDESNRTNGMESHGNLRAFQREMRQMRRTGLQPGLRRDGKSPCNCVLRNIFRACLKRFYFCADNEPYRSKVVLMPCQGYDVNATWTRTGEDYMADFYLVAKRILTELEFKLFRYHFLLGADWNLCCRRLGMNRGTFFPLDLPD